MISRGISDNAPFRNKMIDWNFDFSHYYRRSSLENRLWRETLSRCLTNTRLLRRKIKVWLRNDLTRVMPRPSSINQSRKTHAALIAAPSLTSFSSSEASIRQKSCPMMFFDGAIICVPGESAPQPLPLSCRWCALSSSI